MYTHLLKLSAKEGKAVIEFDCVKGQQEDLLYNEELAVFVLGLHYVVRDVSLQKWGSILV